MVTRLRKLVQISRREVRRKVDMAGGGGGVMRVGASGGGAWGIKRTQIDAIGDVVKRGSHGSRGSHKTVTR